MSSTPRLRLILAVSADAEGWLSLGPDDDMKWTGRVDKGIFQLLTTSDAAADKPQVLLAGRVTAALMPKLPRRTVVALSNDWVHGVRLADAARLYPGAWLIGGPTVALQALRAGLVQRTYLCRCPVRLDDRANVAAGAVGEAAIKEQVREWQLRRIVIGENTVEVYERGA